MSHPDTTTLATATATATTGNPPAATIGAKRPLRSEPSALHKLGWLMRREFWEHKGSFLWAPVIAGAITLLFTVLGGITGQWFFNRTGGMVSWDGQQVPLSQVDWNRLMADASPDARLAYGEGINMLTLFAGAWPLVVLAFVVFFYLLSSLHDERKDRSILFWKSLPVSDALTVWSKLLMGVLVAPLIAIAVTLLLMLAFGLLLTGFILFNGGDPWAIYWSQLRPLQLLLMTVGTLPMYALWALPTAGWLLLVSAWARSRPFLWAVLLPLLTGAIVSWFGVFENHQFGKWLWQNVIARILTGTWPGAHLLGYLDKGEALLLGAEGGIRPGTELIALGVPLLTGPALWIGAAAGIAMTLIAIRLRRWRDEG